MLRPADPVENSTTGADKETDMDGIRSPKSKTAIRKSLDDNSTKHRKWQAVNKVAKGSFFVHRSQIQHCEQDKGRARPLDGEHVAEIKYGRMSDPYGDFSPLMLTLLPEDNPGMDNSLSVEQIKQRIRPMLLHKLVDVFDGAEETVVLETLNFRVFGHQHLFQGSSEAYDLLEDNRPKQKALEYFQAYVYVGMSYDELEELGNYHNKIGHITKRRDSTEIMRSIRRQWIKKDRPQPEQRNDKKYLKAKTEIFSSIKIEGASGTVDRNNYSSEWTLATSPSDEFFDELTKLFDNTEKGILLHQGGERRKEQKVVAKEEKRIAKQHVSLDTFFMVTYVFNDGI